MKLKTFFGPNIPTVMDKIRTELGENVLIISSHRLPDGSVKLITAIETELDVPLIPHQNTDLKELLKRHHLPTDLIDRLLAQTNADTLESFLQSTFDFAPLSLQKTNRVYALIGPHGSGKTTALIKLALQAKLNHLSPCLLTTDVVKAGAREQLISFCKIAQIPFLPLNDLNTLNNTLETTRRHYNFILIDTMGISYLSETDLAFLKQLKKTAHGVEFLLTLPAGLDVMESADIATAFAQIGANRLIATRLDASQYAGNLLYAAFQNNLPFAAFGNSPSLTDAFDTPTPRQLAALLGEHA